MDIQIDMPQLFYSLLLSDQSENILLFESLQELFTIQELSIDIGAARTGTLFRPAKSMGVEDINMVELLINSHGDLRSDKLLPSYATYAYRYLSIDYDNDTLKDILRSCHKGYYEQAVHEYERISQQQPAVRYDFPAQYAELAEHAGAVYDSYTVLPEALPTRVATLAHELTRDLDNDYDKIKALEQYLVGFPYTLTPETVPRDRDFVDYFLFDGQEGYCTYYASALAVMSRCIGLPSRYVEGYLMPEKRNQDGTYSVTNELAHSWVEVYFEGFGWVPFEATAPYSYAFYQQPVPRNTSVFSSDFVQDSAYAEYLRQMAIRQGDYPQIVEAEAARAFDKQPRNFITTFTRLLSILLTALLVVSAYYLFIGIRMLQEKKRHEKIKTLAVNQQAQEYFRGIIRLTRYYRYPIQANETPMQYANRIGRRFVFNNEKLSILDLARLYYQAKYGDSEISDRELLVMEAAYYELIDYVRAYRRRQVFLWNRYVIRSM